jgi:hypothetical protein
MVSQGDNGKLILKRPAKPFVVAMECDTFGAAIDALKVLPNVQIEEGKFDNGKTSVIMLNWFKYQVDSTGYERVKRSRYKRRGEESREEQEERRVVNKVKKPKNTPPVSKFQKPTPQEVTDYSRSIGYDLNGGRFCDFYESKGWRIGNTPMKSWQAAVRTWKQKDQEDKGHASNDSEGVSEYEAISRSARQAKGLRKVASPGSILARVRDLPDVQHNPEAANGNRLGADGVALEEVCGDTTKSK